MTTREPRAGPGPEDELLQQWAFLDRLVERQATQLRAGLQDSEEVDDPELDTREVDRLRQELSALTEAHRQLVDERAALVGRLAILEADLARVRRRAETLERDLLGLRQASREQLSQVSARLEAAEAERQAAERSHTEAEEALRRTQQELQSLRPHRAFWRPGRRQP
jgi:chromosome segregation ATPase